MKYSPKYKLKAAKLEISEKSDENLALKQQIAALTEQNMNLKKKLQLSSSSLSLINEELQLKATLSSEELQNLAQNNQILQAFLLDLQRKVFALSQELHKQKTATDALIQENSKLFYENSAIFKEKAGLAEKLAKKKRRCESLEQENRENRKEIEDLRRENADFQENARSLLQENRELQDKLYKIQDNFQRKDEVFLKDQQKLEKCFAELQKNYDKLFAEFSKLERLRDEFVQENSQKTAEIQHFSEKIAEISQEKQQIVQENSRFMQENAEIKQDLKALVLAMSSENEDLLSLTVFKSFSQEIAVLKAFACEFLRKKRANLKKEKKFVKEQSSLLKDLRDLQDKLSESPVKPALSLRKASELPEKLEKSAVVSSNSAEIRANLPAFSKKHENSCEMLMVIGALLQIIEVIDAKFQWRTRFKEITRFSLDYFLRIHAVIKQNSQDLFVNSQKKTQKHVVFRRKAVKKLRKCAYVVVFAEILLQFRAKKRRFQENPGFFQANFSFLAENHVLRLAQDHFLLNNLLLNEISAVFSRKFASFQHLLNEILAIDCYFANFKRNPAPLRVDCSVIDVDNSNFLRIVREIEGFSGFSGKSKGNLSEKAHKELETRIKSLNSEKKSLQRKLDVRSKKLEDAERKSKERKFTLTSSKKEASVSNF